MNTAHSDITPCLQALQTGQRTTLSATGLTHEAWFCMAEQSRIRWQIAAIFWPRSAA